MDVLTIMNELPFSDLNTTYKVIYNMLFISEMLCISFQFPYVHSDTTDNLYYQLLRERKENLLTNRIPYNGYEEMIKLTNEGKMWHYPIDNEQGTCVRRLNFQHLRNFCLRLTKTKYSLRKKISFIK